MHARVAPEIVFLGACRIHDPRACGGDPDRTVIARQDGWWPRRCGDGSPWVTKRFSRPPQPPRGVARSEMSVRSAACPVPADAGLLNPEVRSLGDNEFQESA
ncbi:hypothetical protein Srubr_46470 [Streptomyces rubradiris]|uniref:Uncharacterized protein n=1 Tax=Streptomyces rubradiris TaxID=285531 RepID=A0ABQ3RG40_STRRR|nr:hypothetical protein GCM10018792_53610 [Streptomyces rubradiris]GHI54801.1 hypothetical protein Srubr_46470 [Streptomyces rubradiris]